MLTKAKLKSFCLKKNFLLKKIAFLKLLAAHYKADSNLLTRFLTKMNFNEICLTEN